MIVIVVYGITLHTEAWLKRCGSKETNSMEKKVSIVRTVGVLDFEV